MIRKKTKQKIEIFIWDGMLDRNINKLPNDSYAFIDASLYIYDIGGFVEIGTEMFVIDGDIYKKPEKNKASLPRWYSSSFGIQS